MLSLIIDTSTEQSFIALCHKDQIIKRIALPEKIKQSQSLIPEIKKLFADEGLTFNAISMIGIGIGPGSFSGTRIGVMTAKTLSYALHIPLLPFCSLEGYFPEREGPFAILLDAKAKSFYCLEGVREGKVARYPAPPLLLKADQLPQDRPLFSPQLHLFNQSINLSPIEFNMPHMSTLIYERWKKGLTKNYKEVKVLYLRDVS